MLAVFGSSAIRAFAAFSAAFARPSGAPGAEYGSDLSVSRWAILASPSGRFCDCGFDGEGTVRFVIAGWAILASVLGRFCARGLKGEVPVKFFQ